MYKKNSRGEQPPRGILHPSIHKKIQLRQVELGLKSFTAVIEHLLNNEISQEEKDRYVKTLQSVTSDYRQRGDAMNALMDIMVKNGITTVDVDDISFLKSFEYNWLIEKGIAIVEPSKEQEQEQKVVKNGN